MHIPKYLRKRIAMLHTLRRLEKALDDVDWAQVYGDAFESVMLQKDLEALSTALSFKDEVHAAIHKAEMEIEKVTVELSKQKGERRWKLGHATKQAKR